MKDINGKEIKIANTEVWVSVRSKEGIESEMKRICTNLRWEKMNAYERVMRLHKRFQSVLKGETFDIVNVEFRGIPKIPEDAKRMNALWAQCMNRIHSS